jgi:hypothetical protein
MYDSQVVQFHHFPQPEEIQEVGNGIPFPVRPVIGYQAQILSPRQNAPQDGTHVVDVAYRETPLKLVAHQEQM